jgi:SAM-dependent methyltransferase
MNSAEEKLWWFRAMHLFVRRCLPSEIHGATLDIGCGTGSLLRQFADAGLTVFGLDYSRIALGFAKKRVKDNLVRASANELPFAAAFELVVSVDVLEVVTVSPERMAMSAAASLKPGGYGLFVMAAHQWLLSDHDRAVNSVRRYNLRQLRDLFEARGLKVRRASYFFLLVFPLVVARKLFNPYKGSADRPVYSDVRMLPEWINQPLFLICWLESQILRFFNLPAGSSAMVLVQKDG